mgnify:CR=1 FL=1
MRTLITVFTLLVIVALARGVNAAFDPNENN